MSFIPHSTLTLFIIKFHCATHNVKYKQIYSYSGATQATPPQSAAAVRPRWQSVSRFAVRIWVWIGYGVCCHCHTAKVLSCPVLSCPVCSVIVVAVPDCLLIKFLFGINMSTFSSRFLFCCVPFFAGGKLSFTWGNFWWFWMMWRTSVTHSCKWPGTNCKKVLGERGFVWHWVELTCLTLEPRVVADRARDACWWGCPEFSCVSRSGESATNPSPSRPSPPCVCTQFLLSSETKYEMTHLNDNWLGQKTPFVVEKKSGLCN